MPEKITSYFGTGDRLGVELNYISEDEPLGTAGALAMVDDSEEPLLVMNGDILTRVDFRALVRFHQQRGADLTIGVRQFEMEVPYGVVDAADGMVRGLREKPKCGFLVNAGVYMLAPRARRRIPEGRKYNMTDLIADLLVDGRMVACFPIVEYWLDIGQHDDFQRAQHEVRQVKWAA
jgi:NDP-sugar pyrophosphorylase family protein